MSSRSTASVCTCRVPEPASTTSPVAETKTLREGLPAPALRSNLRSTGRRWPEQADTVGDYFLQDSAGSMRSVHEMSGLVAVPAKDLDVLGSVLKGIDKTRRTVADSSRG